MSDKDKKGKKKKNKEEEKNEEEKKKKKKEAKKEKGKKDENKEEKDIRFKKEINSFPIFLSPNSPLQLLSNINSEMDSLSSTLKNNFGIYSFSSLNNQDFNINYSPSFITNNYNNYYDKEDFEIKELIIKANKLINNNKNNRKINNILSNDNDINKFKNKRTLSNELDYKYTNGSNDIFTNNFNNNFIYNNNNTNSDFYKYNNQKNRMNRNRKYSSKNNCNFDNDDSRNNYYINNRKKNSVNNDLYYVKKKDFINNYDNENYDNDNVIFQKYDFNDSNYQKKDEKSFDTSIKNKTKKIEDLYKYTNNPRRKPMIYTQPESLPINKISSYLENDNKRDNNYNKNMRSRDNNFIKKNSYLRFDNKGVNRGIDILNGKI